MDIQTKADWKLFPNEIKEKIVMQMDLRTRFRLMACSCSDFAITKSAPILTDVLTITQTGLEFNSDEQMGVLHHFRTRYNWPTQYSEVRIERMRKSYEDFCRAFNRKIIAQKLILSEISKWDIQFLKMIDLTVEQIIEIKPQTGRSFPISMEYVGARRCTVNFSNYFTKEFTKYPEFWSLTDVSIRQISHDFNDDILKRMTKLRTFTTSWRDTMTQVGLKCFIKNWLENPNPESYYFLLAENESDRRNPFIYFRYENKPNYSDYLREFKDVKTICSQQFLWVVKNKGEVGRLEVSPYVGRENAHYVRFVTYYQKFDVDEHFEQIRRFNEDHDDENNGDSEMQRLIKHFKVL